MDAMQPAIDNLTFIWRAIIIGVVLAFLALAYAPPHQIPNSQSSWASQIATITTLFTAKSDRSTVMFHSDAVSLEIDDEGSQISNSRKNRVNWRAVH
jgi:hypothetical protein